MQDFKRKHFEAVHPGVPFPPIEALSQIEARTLRARLAGRLGSAADDGLTLVQQLAARSVLVQGATADSDRFRLLQTLWRLRIRPQPALYINWYRFDEIDRVGAEDLARHFADIWYPSSDDIDILDDTCDWILSIGHSGDIRVARLGSRHTVSA